MGTTKSGCGWSGPLYGNAHRVHEGSPSHPDRTAQGINGGHYAGTFERDRAAGGGLSSGNNKLDSHRKIRAA